jgi:histidinol-phosphatase (PHP family)
VLTDYHLHLRPDEDGTTAERYFTSENVDRYR